MRTITASIADIRSDRRRCRALLCGAITHSITSSARARIDGAENQDDGEPEDFKRHAPPRSGAHTPGDRVA